MEDLIYKILEDIPNVYEGWYRNDINSTHTTFKSYNSKPSEFADDQNESIQCLIQVDTWGTDDEEVNEQYLKVRKLLRDNDFLWQEGNKDYETDTGIYHYADRFVISVNED